MKKQFELININAYVIATNLSDKVWNIISDWNWFNKQTLGTQWVRAVDSIAGNIAEGYGRYHKKDKIKFYYNARASVYESIHWAQRAVKRKLINKENEIKIITKLETLPKEINILIKITNQNLNK